MTSLSRKRTRQSQLADELDKKLVILSDFGIHADLQSIISSLMRGLGQPLSVVLTLGPPEFIESRQELDYDIDADGRIYVLKANACIDVYESNCKLIKTIEIDISVEALCIININDTKGTGAQKLVLRQMCGLEYVNSRVIRQCQFIVCNLDGKKEHTIDGDLRLRSERDALLVFDGQGGIHWNNAYKGEKCYGIQKCDIQSLTLVWYSVGATRELLTFRVLNDSYYFVEQIGKKRVFGMYNMVRGTDWQREWASLNLGRLISAIPDAQGNMILITEYNGERPGSRIKGRFDESMRESVVMTVFSKENGTILQTIHLDPSIKYNSDVFHRGKTDGCRFNHKANRLVIPIDYRKLLVLSL